MEVRLIDEEIDQYQVHTMDEWMTYLIYGTFCPTEEQLKERTNYYEPSSK